MERLSTPIKVTNGIDSGYRAWVAAIGFLLLALGPRPQIQAQSGANDISKKLKGFDAYMQKVLKDWNAPAVGVGIVVDDKLVFAKGYGYRDYEKKLPFTSSTHSCGDALKNLKNIVSIRLFGVT